MPLVVIPARKGNTGSWFPEKEWEKEDKNIPPELDRTVINNLVATLAMTQMGLDKQDYGMSYYPFYQQSVRVEAFKKVEKGLSKLLRGSSEWKFLKETYDTDDVYLKFSRFRK